MNNNAWNKPGNPNYITVNPNNETSNNSSQPATGFGDKLKSLKSMIKFPSFNSTSSDNSDIETKGETPDYEPEAPKVKTCKDKVEDKIIETLEVERNISVFWMLIALGCGMICLSFFWIPLIITSPAKFSLCFAWGSLLVLISFLFYHGTKAYVKLLFEPKRFWVSLTFIASIIIGCGFALGRNYIISLICSIIQFFSLIVFILSFMPGGDGGIRCIKNLATSPFRGLWMRMASSGISG